MKKLFSLSLLFAVILVGCKKDDDVKVDVKAQLTAATKGWVFTSIKVNGAEAIDGFIDECDQDNSIIFASDGKFTEAGNETKCDSQEPATLDSGTWSLNSDNTELTITSSDSDGFALVLKKVSITETTITGEYSESGGGITIVANVTLTKKS